MGPRTRVVRTLYSGRFTEVLEIEHTGQANIGRRLALKRTRPDAPEEVRQHLLNEAKVGMQLEHPHLGAVLDFDVIGGQPTLLMQLIEGIRLDDIVGFEASDVPSIPLEYVLTWVRDVASALMYLHTPYGRRRTRVVHGDISPGNILVSCHGYAKLIDFGNSFVTGAMDGTTVNETVGTAGFMSPEQCRGEPLGPESDVYALGCVMRYALTAKVPGSPLDDTADIDAEVGGSVGALLKRVTAPDRTQRIANAAALAQACDALINDLGKRPCAWEIGRWTQSLVEQTRSLARPRKTFADLFQYGVSAPSIDIESTQPTPQSPYEQS